MPKRALLLPVPNRRRRRGGGLSAKDRRRSASTVATRSLASLLSRALGLTRLRVDASPYCFAVFVLLMHSTIAIRIENKPTHDVMPFHAPAATSSAAAAARMTQRWTRGGVRAGGGRLRLDGLRELAVVGLKGGDPEEYRVLEVLLGSAPRSLERTSLTFRDDAAAASIVDEIATDVPAARFPTAAGR